MSELGMTTGREMNDCLPDATIESISGLAVMRCSAIVSGSMSIGMRSTNGISASTPAAPSRCVNASRC